MQYFQPLNISNARAAHIDTIGMLRFQASQRQSLLTPRNLSAIIWAWGTFGYAPLAMPFLLEVTEARMQQSNDQDLANIMLGLASCEQPRLATPSLMRTAEQHACSIAASFSPQVCPGVLSVV